MFEFGHFHFHRLRRELSNYSILHLYRSDGAIVSMHQGGTHWLKFMLAHALSAHYGIPPPRYNHANDIIGGSKDPIQYAQIPHLRSSHTIAPLLFRNTLALHVTKFPPCVLLIRDIRASLVSNYKKWRTRYAVTFSKYLRGDPSGRRFNSDIWWCIRFLNAWGTVAAIADDRILVVRYEHLLLEPHAQLERITRHLELPLSPLSVEQAVAAATKSAMAARSDPARPPGEINQEEDDPLAVYNASDREFIESRCANFLHKTFDYDYSAWG